jgi:hypothetical protein
MSKVKLIVTQITENINASQRSLLKTAKIISAFLPHKDRSVLFYFTAENIFADYLSMASKL